MNTIVLTYPEDYQESLTIDIAIEVKFDQEIKDEFLTSDYFKIFVLPNYASNINCEITKDSTDSNKVLLVPTMELPTNTDFEVWVAGDMDTDDATIQGVQSLEDVGMDGNYTFHFTTGEEREIDIIDEEDGVTDTEDDEEPAYIITVEKTNPKANAYEIPCSGYPSPENEIDVYFDQPVVLGDIPAGDTSGDMLSIVTVPLDDIDSYLPYNAIHGFVTDPDDVEISYHPDYSNHKVLRFTLSNYFRCNSDIVITLDDEFVKISGSTTAYTMSDDYEFEFRTVLYPMLTTPRAVKSRLRHSIQNISDKIVDEYILSVSLDVVHRYYNGTITAALYSDRWVKKLVTCLVAKELITSVTGGYLGIVRERTLGDLSVRYEPGALREVASSIDECVYASEAHVGKDHIVHGVKSSESTYYPGRRRGVFKSSTDISDPYKVITIA